MSTEKEMKNRNPHTLLCFFETRTHCVALMASNSRDLPDSVPQVLELKNMPLLLTMNKIVYLDIEICTIIQVLANGGGGKKNLNFLKSQSTVRIYLLHQSSRFGKDISKRFTEYDCIFPFTILYDVIGKVKEIQTVGICS